MPNSVILSAAAVGAGTMLLLGAVACSSFTLTATAASTDAASEASELAANDGSASDGSSVASDAGTIDPSLDAALAPSHVNDCTAWAIDAHSASFQPSSSGTPDHPGCRLCGTAVTGPSYVQLKLPSLPGTYTIKALGRPVDGVAVTWGIGFRRAMMWAGESRTSSPGSPAALDQDSLPSTDPNADIYAALELDDASDRLCVDIAEITISYTAN